MTTTPRHRAASGQGTSHAPAAILALVFFALLGLWITLSITGL